jgi:hypothetical protein
MLDPVVVVLAPTGVGLAENEEQEEHSQHHNGEAVLPPKALHA